MSNAAAEPKSKLNDIVSVGIAIDLYHVEEVLSLDEFVGREADRINAATFGRFFGSLQVILGRFLILQAARIFEQYNPRYPIRSIPAGVKLLRAHSDQLVIEQREGLIRSLVRLGAPHLQLKSLSDPDLTRFTAEFFDRRLSDCYPEGIDNARAVLALKTVRDKKIAHPEAISSEHLPKSTFADIDQLASFAKAFIGAVGFGYLNIAYEDDGGHFLSFDAKKSTVSLRRLLQKANVLPDKH